LPFISLLKSIKKKKMSARSEELREEFKNAETPQDIAHLMLRTMKENLPSPLYGFDDAEEENTDNSWWTDANPAFLLLQRINEFGMVTLEAQECDAHRPPGYFEPLVQGWKDDGYLAINCRTSLVGALPRRIASDVLFEMQERGFFVITQDDNFDVEELRDELQFITSAELVTPQNERKRLSSLLVRLQDNVFRGPNYAEDLYPVMNSAAVQKWKQEMLSVAFIDPVWNRPAANSNGSPGLFVALTEVLGKIHNSSLRR
jgi:hypothetical protein